MAKSGSKKGGSPKGDKKPTPKKPAPEAATSHHVGELTVHAAEEAPEPPAVKVVEVAPPPQGGKSGRSDGAPTASPAPEPEGPAQEEVEPDVEEEADEAPPASGPENRDQLAEVMAHLLFHKSLIRDADTGADVNRYLALAKDVREGVHVVIDNPFDKCIALVFELVINERMNPWDIDLRSFSKLYLSRVKGQPEVDFISAGKLMLMAWSVLKAQTEEVLTAIQRLEAQRKAEQDAAAQAAGQGMEFLDDRPWLGADETTFNFTETVINADPFHVSEAIHPPGERPVTLYDLVNAFEEAKEEGATRMILEEERAKARAELERARKAKVSGMMHNENLEEEIANTWMRILDHIHKQESPAAKVPMDDLHNGSRDDFLTVFISSLFLAFNQRLLLSQDPLPTGQIMLQLTPEAQQGKLSPMPTPPTVGPAPPAPKPKRGRKGPAAPAKGPAA